MQMKAEPIHVHCRKPEMECKYWLNRENFDLDEAFTYNMSPRDKRQIRKIIYEHFEQQWDEFQQRTPEMEKYHDNSSLKFEDGFLLITIDGELKKFP